MGGRDAMNAEQRELWERIEKVRPAMMTTAESDGSFRSRPMWTQGDEFQGSLWFFVSDDGPLARELERNPRVGLSYAAPDGDLYLSVSGRAALVAVPTDYARIRTDDAACASAWRDASAEAIEACLTAGMIAAGFDRESSSYVFALAEDVPR